MMRPSIVSLLLALAAAAPIGAANTASTQQINHQSIQFSHAYHYSERQALIKSVLSDVRRRIFSNFLESDGAILDIDVSSSRLGDEATLALAEGLFSTLQEKVDSNEKELEKGPISVKLELSMNKITPSGASKLFDLLVGEDEKNVTNALLNETTTTTTTTTVSSGEEKVEENDKVTGDNESKSNGTLVADEECRDDDDDKVTTSKPDVTVDEIDLSFNDLGNHGMQLLNSARKLFEGGKGKIVSGVRMPLVPRVLIMENCGLGPAFCRSIGRGILNSAESKYHVSRPRVLHLGGNHAIGDAGTVALAAALRLATQSPNTIHNNKDHGVMEELDLSSCSVGDAGAEALALALAFNPGCLARLDLSNNKVTDNGAKALGRALVEASRVKFTRGDESRIVLEELVLDNNMALGDEGAAALADAVACGSVKSLSIRSCSVRAEGASAFGKAIVTLAPKNQQQTSFAVDLSGNHFGTLKPKKKKGYSASMIRDKASTHISFIGKSIQSRLKGAGVSMGVTAESDDDEENVMGGLIDGDDDTESSKLLETSARCGARSFSGEILKEDNEQVFQNSRPDPESAKLKVCIGMRQCCLDQGAIDALSATILGARDENIDLSIDVSMNAEVDAATEHALLGKTREVKLVKQAERHMEALAVLRQARKRAELASTAASSRVHTEMGGMFSDEDEVDEYDDDFDSY